MADHEPRGPDTAPGAELRTYETPRQLDLAVVASLDATVQAAAGLRAAVGDRVRYLRGRGAPPERVVIAIKRATHEALARAVPRMDTLAGAIAVEDASRAVMGQAVTAAVEAYYG
jgi:hypothetical protein